MHLKLERINGYVLAICMIIFVGACAPQSISSTITPTTAVTSVPPEWFMQWLENPTCSPPCWESITPGITSINDTSNIQQKYSSVYLKKQKDSSTVLSVTLDLAYEHVPAKLILKRYGQPDYVRLYKCDPGASCETHVIYEKLGMVVNFYLSDTNNQEGWTVEISPESKIFRVYFIETGLDKYWYNFPPAPYKIDKWTGYGGYSDE